MATLKIRRIHSLEQLRAAAPIWDDLWLRSQATLPTMRAELVAQWLETFQPNAPLRAIAVEDEQGRFVAALPIWGERRLPLLNVAALPGDSWSFAGDILLDESETADEALQLLAEELKRSRWPLLWFDAVQLALPRWIRFVAALTAAGCMVETHERFRIGHIDLRGSWDAYWAARSKNHRRQMRRCRDKAVEDGDLNLRIVRPKNQAEAAPWVRIGFEIENRGWKAANHSSVLETPGVLDFYIKQAGQLGAWGQSKMVFLEYRGEPIAFEYGWEAKGTYFSPKVGYDEAYGRFTPGQLLRYDHFQHMKSEGQTDTIDFLGPLTTATNRWTEDCYSISRLVISTGRWRSRAAMQCYRALRPCLAALRNRNSATAEPTLDLREVESPKSGAAAQVPLTGPELVEV